MPFCKYCGSDHDADTVFCTECGKPIVKKAAVAAKAVQEVPVAAKTEEIIRVEDGERPYLPGDPITPEMEAEMQAYQARVAQYTISLTIFKQLFRNHPDLFGEEDWRLAESALAEKYGLSDISIFRQKEPPDFAAEQNTSTPTHRRNATYTKRKTDYWSQFDKNYD